MKVCNTIRFSNMCKTWGRIRLWIGIVFKPIQIRIGIGMEIWIRIGITTMRIHNTGKYKDLLLYLFCFLCLEVEFRGIAISPPF